MGTWNIAYSALVGGIVGGLSSAILASINKSREKKLPSIVVIAVVVIASFGVTTFINVNAQGEPREKAFSKAGMTITLNDSFVEKELVAYTAYFESKTTAVLVVKEEFYFLEQLGLPTDISLYEYGKKVGENNYLEYDVTIKDGLAFSEFNNTVNGKDFSYLAVFFRGDDAYWVVQFTCESKNYGKYSGDFFKWAKSVEV